MKVRALLWPIGLLAAGGTVGYVLGRRAGAVQVLPAGPTAARLPAWNEHLPATPSTIVIAPDSSPHRTARAGDTLVFQGFVPTATMPEGFALFGEPDQVKRTAPATYLLLAPGTLQAAWPGPGGVDRKLSVEVSP